MANKKKFPRIVSRIASVIAAVGIMCSSPAYAAESTVNSRAASGVSSYYFTFAGSTTALTSTNTQKVEHFNPTFTVYKDTDLAVRYVVKFMCDPEYGVDLTSDCDATEAEVITDNEGRHYFTYLDGEPSTYFEDEYYLYAYVLAYSISGTERCRGEWDI